jgi:thiol-disulfide isomerase/thioredoxin
MNKLLIIVALILSSATSSAQQIKFRVANYKDTTVNLIRYHGNKLYMADTAQLKNGVVVFDGSKHKPGIMALYFPDQKYAEFIFNKEEMDISIKYPDFIPSMVVKKSEENKLFIEYIRYMADMRKKSEEASKKENAKEEMKALNEQVVAYQTKLIAENPKTYVSKIVNMSKDIVIPESPKNPDGSLIDSTFSYRYFRDHYFDNVDLNDDRLVNTPVFHNKVESFFSERMLLQVPDTIIKYAVNIIDQLDPKSEVFKYIVHFVTYKYETSKIMGHDKVFVAMAQKYYCPGYKEGKSNITWMTEEKLKTMCERAEILQNLVLGVRPPNISLRDTTDVNWVNFYDLKSEYTILYFWDPECGHCKKETPKLQRLYAEKFKARNIEIFAVGKATGDDFEKWKAFIKKNKLEFINVGLTKTLYEQASKDWRQFIPQYTNVQSLNYSEHYDIFATPKVFILDKDKKIIAKGLSISQMEDLLDRLQDVPDAPKLFPKETEDKKGKNEDEVE